MSPDGAPALALRGLEKVYPPAVHALRGVDMTLAPGEIRALVGMNGAGKSTMIKMLGGNEAPTAGSIEVDGSRVRFSAPHDAAAAGIGVVHQELPLLPNLTAADNVALGLAEGRTFGAARRAALRSDYDAVARRIPGAPPADALLEELDIDAWQLVAIVRALASGARVLVLDEPTSSLNAAERDSLHARLRVLVREGVAVIYVSHFLDDVLDIADSVTVLRDGRVVHDGPREGLTPRSLLQLMTGQERVDPTVASPAERPPGLADEPGLVVRGLDTDELGPVDLSVGRGECVGVYGLRGSGATHVVEALYGLRRAGGSAWWRGTALVGPVRSRQAAGLSFVSGNRPRTVIADWTVAMNHGLPQLAGRPSPALMPSRSERERASSTVQRFGVVGGADLPMRALSGGNQQKVSLGRALLDPDVLLLADEPSRGVDAFARIAIHDALRDVCTAGGAVLVHSTEAEELVAVCHRVLVLVGGRLVAELSGADLHVAALEEAIASPSSASPPQLAEGNRSA